MEQLILFLFFAFSANFTPGPNNFLILNSGLHFGTKRSLPHLMGICVGFPIMILGVGLGLGAVLAQYSWLHHFFKVAGSLYMLYLAWKIWQSSGNSAKLNQKNTLKPMTFLQAALFQWINPKAWIIAIGVVSIFTLSDDYLVNALIISVLMVMVCFASISTWLLGGVFLKRIIKDPKHLQWFNRIMAGVLALSIALLFV